MHYFNYKNGHLHCDEVPVREIAQKIDTPFYLYSSRTINHHIDLFEEAFKNYPHLFCYSMKANSNLSILALIAKRGWGVDIVSGGELFRALKAGIEPKKIVYAGIGKKYQEIRDAVGVGILLINVESIEELELIEKIGDELKKEVSAVLRINPKIEPKTHHHIATGEKWTKFGFSFNQAKEIIFNSKKNLRYTKIKGLHVHIGSQITSLKPYEEVVTKMVDFIGELKKENFVIEWLNIGGGMGIIYKEEESTFTPLQLKESILPLISKVGCKILIEPGRFIVGNAGVLVTKVLYVKEREDKNFIIVDVGMNDLIRIALYGAYHDIIAEEEKEEMILADVVGPVCESGDFFAKDRNVPKVKEGEYLVIMGTGAYGFSMASNYNSRPRPAEVLIDEKRCYLIRREESYHDLIQEESIPPRLIF